MSPEDIERACRGDREALDALTSHLQPVIVAQVRWLLRKRAPARGRDAGQDVEDFAQDVLLRLLERDGRELRRWDPERGMSLEGFVRKIARDCVNRGLRGFRGNRWATEATDPEVLESLQPEQSGPFRTVAARLHIWRIRRRLRKELSERSWTLYRLVYIEQASISDVCETMGMSRAAVDTWNSRLRTRVLELEKETA